MHASRHNVERVRRRKVVSRRCRAGRAIGTFFREGLSVVRPAGRVRDFVVVVHIRLRTDVNRETRSLLQRSGLARRICML